LKYYKEKFGPLSIGDFGSDGFVLSPWFGAGVADWGGHSLQGVESASPHGVNPSIDTNGTLCAGELITD